jgi:hypothetical protein
MPLDSGVRAGRGGRGLAGKGVATRSRVARSGGVGWSLGGASPGTTILHRPKAEHSGSSSASSIPKDSPQVTRRFQLCQAGEKKKRHRLSTQTCCTAWPGRGQSIGTSKAYRCPADHLHARGATQQQPMGATPVWTLGNVIVQNNLRAHTLTYPTPTHP